MDRLPNRHSSRSSACRVVSGAPTTWASGSVKQPSVQHESIDITETCEFARARPSTTVFFSKYARSTICNCESRTRKCKCELSRSTVPRDGFGSGRGEPGATETREYHEEAQQQRKRVWDVLVVRDCHTSGSGNATCKSPFQNQEEKHQKGSSQRSCRLIKCVMQAVLQAMPNTLKSESLEKISGTAVAIN